MEYVREMKVLHINSTYGRGGAANLMVMLSDQLKRMYDVENYHLVAHNLLGNSEVKVVQDDQYRFGQRKLQRILIESGFLDVFLPAKKKSILKVIKDIQPDIIHLHNVHGYYFQLNLLKKLQTLAPVIWTFHDMFPITGHCAHSFNCNRWKNGCGECPYLETYPEIKKDRTNFLWKYKKKIYNSSDFSIVVPSIWLQDCVKKSMLKNKDVQLIYNGVDTNVFKKVEKISARKELNLPLDKKIILFTAHGGKDNEFKGGGYFNKIVDRYRDNSEVYFVCVGGKKETMSNNTVNNYSYVSNQKKLALLYSASDIYLFPTRADNCPLSVLEAMACECPVVTFKVGGVPELVEHMKSGYIAEDGNEDDLIQGIETLLDEETAREMGLNAGKRVDDHFSLSKMSQSYLDLYKEVLKK